MIKITKGAQSIVTRVIPDKNKVFMTKIENIIKTFQVSANDDTQLYIVHSSDVSLGKVKRSWIEALEAKDSSIKVLMLTKGKPLNFPNIDLEVINPTVDSVRDAIKTLLSTIQDKPEVEYKEPKLDDIEEFTIPAETHEEIKEVEEDTTTVFEEPVKADLVEEKEVYKEEVYTPEMLKRIKNVETISNILPLAEEITASALLKDLNKNNATFRTVEISIQAITESITNVMCDNRLSLDEKYSKVRALMFDKNNNLAGAHSIIEQCVFNVVKTLVDKSRDEVNRRLSEIDEQILATSVNYDSGVMSARLSAIIEERSSVLVELSTLEQEIKAAYAISDNLITGASNKIVNDSEASDTASMLEDKLDLKFGRITPESTVRVIESLCAIGADTAEEYKVLTNYIADVTRRLYRLLNLQKEEHRVLAETIKYLKANKVEDTVIANNITKRAISLFIGEKGKGKSVTSYVLAREASRARNTLLLDLTGSSKYSTYGLKPKAFKDFMDNTPKDNFLLVSANKQEVDELSTGDLNRLSMLLAECARHYISIYIVLDVDNSELIEQFIPNALSINYFVDTSTNSISKYKEVINKYESISDNTAKRVINLNSIGSAVDVANSLGIIDRIDFGFVTVPTINAIRVCDLNKQDPYDLEIVKEGFKEVFRIC